MKFFWFDSVGKVLDVAFSNFRIEHLEHYLRNYCNCDCSGELLKKAITETKIQTQTNSPIYLDEYTFDMVTMECDNNSNKMLMSSENYDPDAKTRLIFMLLNQYPSDIIIKYIATAKDCYTEFVYGGKTALDMVFGKIDKFGELKEKVYKSNGKSRSDYAIARIIGEKL